MEDFRLQYAQEYVDEVIRLLSEMKEDIAAQMDRFATILLQARESKKSIFIMGNGGSGSTASHFVCDLGKGTIVEGFPRFKVIALTDNIPTMLAWANDSNYEDVFVEQLKNLFEPGDIAIGFSGSGNSKNVIRAMEYANENGGTTIGISGYDGGLLMKTAQENLHVPSFNMQQVEDIHMLIVHLLTSIIRDEQKQQQ
jgi:D-sedoheptulose 7-phosphate isomerase